MSGIVLTEGSPDKCVRAYAQDDFERQAALYMSQPAITPEGRIMRRHFFSNAFDAELDRQGRVLVPQALREAARLDGQVVIVGAGDYIEIWNAGTFTEAFADEEPEFRQALGSE